MVENKRLKYFVFAIAFGVLIFPFLQSELRLINLSPLNGTFEKTAEPEFSFKDWFKGDYQKQFDKYTEENIGLRNFLIRVNNQFNFSLFRVTQSPGVVIGKNDYLYLTSYTDNFSGKNFIGDGAVESNSTQLKMLQDALKNKNIDLIVVLAPGKATYYSENIPPSEFKNTLKNNYYAYRNAFHDKGVNFIDMNNWFLEMKSNTPYKLYPKYGVHWSYYGAYKAADSLDKYIERLRNCDLPKMKLKQVVLNDSLRNPDYDVGQLLNIFSYLKDTMPYPEIEFSNSALSKPKAVVISDSYAWQWYEQQFLQNTFSDWGFWFYNNTMYPESFTNQKTTGDINYIESLCKKDVVIVLAAEATLDLFPYHILDKTEEMFLPANRENLISFYKMKMLGDSKWKETLTKKANENNTTIEDVMEKDAEWMADTQLSKSK